MKKGFTLAELLVTILVMALVIGIATPSVMYVMRLFNDKSYQSQITFIETSAKSYFDDKRDSEEGIIWEELGNKKYYLISLSDLEGYISFPIKNVKTKEDYSMDTKILVVRENKENHFQLLTEPTILIDEDQKTYKLGDDFSVRDGVVVISNNNQEYSLEWDSNPEYNKRKTGTYMINYYVLINNEKKGNINRKIIIEE